MACAKAVVVLAAVPEEPPAARESQTAREADHVTLVACRMGECGPCTVAGCGGRLATHQLELAAQALFHSLHFDEAAALRHRAQELTEQELTEQHTP